MKCGSFNLLEPSGSVQACNGIALPLPLPFTLHTNFNIPYVSDVIHERINKYHNNLEAHSNPLLEPLLQPINIRRLKRCWPLDLQGTWGDIDGWIPYHVIAIRGTVAYWYNHHISLLIVFFLIANIKNFCRNHLQSLLVSTEGISGSTNTQNSHKFAWIFMQSSY
jgi:hypothetical protein